MFNTVLPREGSLSRYLHYPALNIRRPLIKSTIGENISKVNVIYRPSSLDEVVELEQPSVQTYPRLLSNQWGWRLGNGGSERLRVSLCCAPPAYFVNRFGCSLSSAWAANHYPSGRCRRCDFSINFILNFMCIFWFWQWSPDPRVRPAVPTVVDGIINIMNPWGFCFFLFASFLRSRWFFLPFLFLIVIQWIPCHMYNILGMSTVALFSGTLNFCHLTVSGIGDCGGPIGFLLDGNKKHHNIYPQYLNNMIICWDNWKVFPSFQYLMQLLRLL